MELIKDGVKVEWEDIGEGIHGDYDEGDPEDIPLFRFYISKLVFGEWEEISDASYCTLVPTGTSDDVQRKLLQILMDRVFDEVKNGHSIKKLCERLSWIDPTWIANKED
jgi:hypothetical protein